MRYLVEELCETHSEAADGEMALRYELKTFPLRKVAEDTVVVFVCVSLSPSLLILTRSAACFPDGALRLLLKAEKDLSRAASTSLGWWENISTDSQYFVK